AHLKGMKELRWLFLGSTRVSDAGLRHIKSLENMRHLNLDGTNVTNVGLDHLRGLTKLKQLDLEDTKVTSQGVKRLRKALPKVYIKQGRPLIPPRPNPFPWGTAMFLWTASRNLADAEVTQHTDARGFFTRYVYTPRRVHPRRVRVSGTNGTAGVSCFVWR